MIARRMILLSFTVALGLSSGAPRVVAQAQPPRPSGVAPSRGHATREQKAEAKRLAAALLYSSLIFFIFVIFAWALLRFSRRYRAYLVRDKRAPTPSDDVWAMHRPPPEEMWPDKDSDEEHQS